MMKKMKNIIIILITITFGLVSCAKLDEVPKSSLTSANFPLTDNDAIAATNGVYVPNYIASSGLDYLVDLATDYMESGEDSRTSDGPALSTLAYDEQDGTNEWVWGLFYQGIGNANQNIDNLSASKTISEPLKTRLINESKFLRALYYFYTVQLWGDVPLVLHPSDGTNIKRDSVNQVYRQIVQDLKDATALPASYSETTDKGRPTKGSAFGLLSKVYLTWAQVDGENLQNNDKLKKSVAFADSVTGYVLVDEFLDNWNTTKKYGPEILFTADHTVSQFAPGDGFNHMCHCAFVTGFSQETPHLIISDTIQFYDSWDGRDQRKDGTYAKFLYNPTTNSVYRFDYPRYRKYIDTINILTSATSRAIDRTILRYADVLLIKAEAANEYNHGPNSDAYDAVNQVRKRAYLKYINKNSLAANAFDYSGLSYEQFRDSIRLERLHELTYEQSRWYDLVRWKILKTTITTAGSKSTESQLQAKNKNFNIKYYRFPIPQYEINLNPSLWQNYGYNGSTSNPYDASYQ
jgi:starch-binding outer membrane protein, SusD/RagB family